MSPTLDALTTQALALPPDQRIALAERLWLSVDAPLEDEELFAEIERREAEIEAGGKTYSHDEVMKAARKAIGQ